MRFQVKEGVTVCTRLKKIRYFRTNGAKMTIFPFKLHPPFYLLSPFKNNDLQSLPQKYGQ